MEQHDKKMIAPVIITIIFILYYLAYFVILLTVLPGIIIKLLFGIAPFVLSAVMVYVCIQRMKEIESGEEDDLSQY